MNADRIFNIVGAIVFIGLVTTIVSHRHTAAVVSATGRAASNFLRTAMGQ